VLVSPFGCLEEEELRRRFGGDCLETPFGTICIANLPVQLVDEYGLVAIDPDGGGWQDLPAQKRVFTPGCPPALTELLYRGDRGLQVTAPDGMTRPLLDEPQISNPAWSPDGQRIAVQQYLHDHADIFVLDAAGKVLQRLTAPPSALEKAPNDVAPAWSPDGSYLVFLSDRDGAWKLYRMRSDGADQRLLAPGALSGLAFVYDFAAEKVASWSP
jgi:dipeptidyl aminopeptidase/acylaminoacyl peptidase